MKIEKIKMAALEMNIGQIPGIPMNPRQWSRAEVDRLAKSIRETPELFEARPLLVYPQDGKFVILGGNLRYEASKANKAEEVPCIVFPSTLPADLMLEIAARLRQRFEGAFVPGNGYKVAAGSGETVLCLAVAFPESVFLPMFDNTKPETTREPGAPLVPFLRALFQTITADADNH